MCHPRGVHGSDVPIRRLTACGRSQQLESQQIQHKVQLERERAERLLANKRLEDASQRLGTLAEVSECLCLRVSMRLNVSAHVGWTDVGVPLGVGCSCFLPAPGCPRHAAVAKGPGNGGTSGKWS